MNAVVDAGERAAQRFGRSAAGIDWRAPAPPAACRALSEAIVAERLRRPTAGPALAARLETPVVIVVPDATRATGVKTMFGAVIGTLDAAGVPAGERLVLVAGGLHRRPDRAELDRLLGPRLAGHRVEYHDADHDAELIACGTTRRGTPVEINRQVLAAGTTVLVGGITGHYFAGFTGGWKGIVPGAAGRRTVLANHRLAVAPDRPGGLEPACGEGRLTGNPVYEDLVEAAAGRAPDFLVNAVPDASGAATDVVTGDIAAAHARGTARVREACSLDLPAADVVAVTTSETGRQRDWIQAHKVLRQGAAYARDGGVVIASLRCEEGLGSDSLLDWMRSPPETLAARVHAYYTAHGHTALAMRELQRRLRIILVSRLPDDVVGELGMTPAPDWAAALALARDAVEGPAQGLIIDHAGTLLPPRPRTQC